MTHPYKGLNKKQKAVLAKRRMYGAGQLTPGRLVLRITNVVV